MAKKGGAVKVRLVSPATNKNGNPTGTTYYVKRSPQATEKLKMRKYDPKAWDADASKAGMHVEFTEKKLPPHKKN
jgi:large subunit ribosomal protein L33